MTKWLTQSRSGPREKTGAMVSCKNCGKEFYCFPSRPNKLCCSMACRDAIKKAARVRDGEAKCARCRSWKPLSQFVRGHGGLPHSYCKPCSSEWFHERRGTPVEKRRPYIPAYRLTEEEKKRRKREANHLQHQKRRAGGKAPHRFDIGKMLCLQDGKCVYCGILLADGYHIDHILPVSRGGTNDLSNLQLLCARCNMKKGALTHEEYITSKRNRCRVHQHIRQKHEGR